MFCDGSRRLNAYDHARQARASRATRSPSRSRAAASGASRRSTRRASCRRASGSTCCSTRAASSSSIASSSIARPTSGSSSEKYYGDGVVTGLRPHRRPPRLRLLAGLHRVRRLAVRVVRREDLQDHGSRDAQRRAGDRPQRLRRRAHPGRRRLARRLRRDLSAQHAGVGRRPADLGDPRPVRRRRGVLAGDHRLHLHGARHVVHVRDRARTS